MNNEENITGNFKTRGLSVENVRKNKRETILSLGGANNYSICWASFKINELLGIDKRKKKYE